MNFGDKPIKTTSTFKNLSKGVGILKHRNKNENNENKPLTIDLEINNKIEDIDFLSKFKESQQKIQNDLMLKKKEDNKGQQFNNNQKLRKSTLKSGILIEDNIINDDEYEDEED